MQYKPFDYQELIYNQHMDNKRCLSLVDMGLGKTVATLDSTSDLLISNEVRGVLIVAPPRVCNLTWTMEKDKWDFSRGFKLFNLRRILITPKKSKKDQLRYKNDIHIFKTESFQYYVVNYELLPKLKDLLFHYKDSQMPFDMVVFDEVSMAKSHNSKRINEFRKIIDRFDRRIGLTGTFMPNSYMDVFAQVRLIDGGEALGNRITKFRQKYFTQPNPNCVHQWEIKDLEHANLIDERIAHLTLVLRNDEYGSCAPPNYIDEDITLPVPAMKVYKEMEKELLIRVEEYKNEITFTTNEEELEACNAAVLVNKLLQLASGSIYDAEKHVQHIHNAKIDRLSKLLSFYKKQKKSVLVVTTFKHSMASILELPDIVRWNEKLLDDWNKGRIPVMVSDFRSISHGLNLQQGGHIIIWYSMPYSYEGVMQMDARLARTGQKEIPQIHRLICKDTVDEAVMEALRNKGQSMNTLLATLKTLQVMSQPIIDV